MTHLLKGPAAAVTLCVVMLALLVAVAASGSKGAELPNTLMNPWLIFAGRSPGNRTSGALSDTKARLRHFSLALTQARSTAVLPLLSYNLQEWNSGFGRAPVLEELEFGNMPPRPTTFTDINPASVGPGDAGPGIGAPFENGPGGLPLNVFVPFIDDQIVPPTLPSVGSVGGDITAVPEPSSWLMMMIGFFGIGSILRVVRGKDVVAVKL